MTDPLNPRKYFNGQPIPEDTGEGFGDIDAVSAYPAMDKLELNSKYGKVATEDTDEPGFVARSRKAFTAGAIALAGALALAIPTAFADGVVSVGELVPIGVASLGVGLVGFFGTWATPNDR